MSATIQLDFINVQQEWSERFPIWFGNM